MNLILENLPFQELNLEEMFTIDGGSDDGWSWKEFWRGLATGVVTTLLFLLILTN